MKCRSPLMTTRPRTRNPAPGSGRASTPHNAADDVLAKAVLDPVQKPVLEFTNSTVAAGDDLGDTPNKDFTTRRQVL
jgi:hypothetical protein